jgi:DNA-binding NarL/FixJ family response regulator
LPDTASATVVPLVTAAPTRVRLLLVEDNVGDADLVQELLKQTEGDRFEIRHAMRLCDALHALGGNAFDAILLDLSSPDSYGMETVTRVRAVAPHLPTIVLTGSDDTALALRALREGVQEYVVKCRRDGTDVV